MKLYSKIFILYLFGTFGCFRALAQKLPNKQTLSMRAPINVKIDGKADEWGDQLQAYNSATEIFYSMANDDQKLYFIVQSKDQNVIRKIVNGGITLIVVNDEKKNDAGAPRVKFPYFESGKGISIALYENFQGGPRKDPHGHIADSLIEINNKRLESNIKWLYTAGIFNKDSVISVYNNSGIIAANKFERKQSNVIYTSELSIDLRLLRLSSKALTKFLYHIVVNGEPHMYSINVSANTIKMKGGGMPSPAEMDALKQAMQASAGMAYATTDFWGEYTLAKAP